MMEKSEYSLALIERMNRRPEWNEKRDSEHWMKCVCVLEKQKRKTIFIQF